MANLSFQYTHSERRNNDFEICGILKGTAYDSGGSVLPLSAIGMSQVDGIEVDASIESAMATGGIILKVESLNPLKIGMYLTGLELTNGQDISNARWHVRIRGKV